MPRPPWEFALPIERSDRQPLYLQITRALVQEIRRGRLRPGDPLPGTRVLAGALRVNRVTILAAYHALAAEGWITTHRARGCTVARPLPEEPAAVGPSRGRPFDRLPLYPLTPTPHVQRSPELLRDRLVFASSSPDLRLLDVEPLARAYRRALKRAGGGLLGYADPQGQPGLRAAIAAMLRAGRGMAASTEHVFVTRGSLMGLALVARALLRPGDVVAVEALGYRPAWQAMAAAGAELLPVPVDDEGLAIDALAAALLTRRIAAVYVTPQRQFPTTVAMSPRRRQELLALARAHRFAVIEDDHGHEFQYEGPPPLPLASLDAEGTVVYLGSFSRLLAPGLRLGFVAGPPPLLQRLAAHRELLDMQGDAATEAAVAELIEDGEVQRHVRRVRRVYRERRDVLAALLAQAFGGELSFGVPAGGVGLWARVRSLDVEAWSRAALDRGVAFQTARDFRFDARPAPAVRLGYASLDERELREAVARLRLAAREARPPATS